MATRRKTPPYKNTPSVDEPDPLTTAMEEVVASDTDSEIIENEVVLDVPGDEPKDEVEITPEPKPIAIPPVSIPAPPPKKVGLPRKPRNIPRFSQRAK